MDRNLKALGIMALFGLCCGLSGAALALLTYNRQAAGILAWLSIMVFVLTYVLLLRWEPEAQSEEAKRDD